MLVQELREAKKRHSDSRFGQLIFNAIFQHDHPVPPVVESSAEREQRLAKEQQDALDFHTRLYYIPDMEFEKALKDYQ